MDHQQKEKRVFVFIILIGLIIAFTLGWTAKVVTSERAKSSLSPIAPAAGLIGKSVDAKRQTAGLQDSGAAKVARSVNADAAMSFDQIKESLKTLTTANDCEQLLRQFIEATGKFDSESAISLIRDLPAGDLRESAALALLGLWTGKSSVQLAKEFDKLGAESQLISYLLSKRQVSPAQAGALAKEFLRGSQRTDVLSEAAQALVVIDPNAAFALGSELVGNQQMKFFRNFARMWANSDPASASKWVNQIPDERTRLDLRGVLLESSARKDPVAAAHFALTLPTRGSERYTAVEKAVGEWVRRDTEAAQNWAQQLSEPADQEAAKRGIQEGSVVGVGVVMGEDPNGFIVYELFPGGAAELSGAIKEGDVIQAASDEAGDWVDIRDLSIDEITNLIRGAPQSHVSLSVKSPTDATPRTVTLERKLVMMRPYKK
jgi:hypothetical protein